MLKRVVRTMTERRTMYTPRQGDIGLSTIGGRTGALVNIGQAVIRDSSRFTHAFVHVGNDEVVEAMPGGALLSPASKYPDAFYFSPKMLTEYQRDKLGFYGRKLVGTPYSFLDYLSLSLAHYKLRPKWLKNYVHSTKHMICSQLVDEIYFLTNVHLFNDGRIPGDVTPGDLMYLALTDEGRQCL